jgi:hypothetical protein
MAAVVLASGVALSLNVVDPDLWGHVQYGRDALAHGVPATTTYSYVAQGYPWINHEIVAEYALAILADWGGASGLLVTKCLLGLAIVGAVLWRSRRLEAGLIASCSLTLVVAVGLGNHWSLRPQIASYVCFTLLLGLLTYCFQGWEGTWKLDIASLWRWVKDSPPQAVSQYPVGSSHLATTEVHGGQLVYSVPRLKLLWLAVPLFVIWTNAHGGFLAGLCVFWAYLSLRGVEAFCHKGRAAQGLIKRFALMGAAATLATFINPYGPRFHWWLYHDLAVPRPEILEWRAPQLLSAEFLPFWTMALICVAALALSRRSRDFTQVVILALILWQALAHQRHGAFFVLACGWWLPLHWDSLLARLGVGQRVRSEEEERYGWAASESTAYSAGFSPRMQQAFAILLVVAICVSTGQLAWRLTNLRIEREHYPVAAFDYIARRGLTGKMVCTFNWAQYALAAFGPKSPEQPGILVHVDGRCRTSYSQAMLDAHFDFLMGEVGPDVRYRDPKSGPVDPVRVLEVGRPDLVLISRLQQPSVEVMQQQEGRWVLLYQDALAQLWGRASRYDDPESAYYLPPSAREVGEAVQRGYVRWPALPEYRPRSTAGNVNQVVTHSQ